MQLYLLPAAALESRLVSLRCLPQPRDARSHREQLIAFCGSEVLIEF